MKIKLARQLQQDSIVDGDGIRFVLWTQGCSHNCKGCHNPETHAFDKGFIKDIDLLKEEILLIKNHDGITLSGGDPFFQIDACLEIAKFCHSNKLNVWCYTGFTYDKLMEMSLINPKVLDFLKEIDVLIDGPFKLEEKSLNLKFRGSKNQRIINVKESLKKNRPVLIRKYNEIKGKNIKEEKHLFI